MLRSFRGSSRLRERRGFKSPGIPIRRGAGGERAKGERERSEGKADRLGHEVYCLRKLGVRLILTGSSGAPQGNSAPNCFRT